jgi:multidrug efflux pump subunit AcrA (membrane-fusion protein)
VRETEEKPLSAEEERRRDVSDERAQQRYHDRGVAVADENGGPAHADAAEAERGSHEPPRVKLSPRKVALLGLILLIVFGIIFVIGFLPRLRDRRITQERAERAETALPEVDVVVARRSTSQSDLELPGTTAGLVEAPIYARASGYVSKRLVDIGDRVKAGQLMAVIDAPDLDQQVDQVRGTLLQSQSVLGQTQAQLNLAKVTWDRWNVLVQRGVLSKQEGDTQYANYQVAVANVRAAENTVQANRANLDRMLHLQSYERVIAPFAGIVTARNVDVGSLISATGGGLGSGLSGAALPSTGSSQGGEMFRVAQIDRLRLFVSVPEVYAPYVTVAEAVNCYFDAVSQKPFEGKVTRTANAVDPTTRTLLTEVQVANSDGALLPGMYTRAVFVHLRAEPPVIVPSDSIIARANGITIAVVQDGVVHIRKATIGRDYGAQTEVLSGVNPGDLVIINPTDAAQDGAKVNAHELKQGPQPGGATPGQQSAPGQGKQQPNQQRNQQNVQPLNPEKNVPLTKGPEPGAPGELQGPGPVINPQPTYGSYNAPQASQSGRSGNPSATTGTPAGKNAMPGKAGPSSGAAGNANSNPPQQ